MWHVGAFRRPVSQYLVTPPLAEITASPVVQPANRLSVILCLKILSLIPCRILGSSEIISDCSCIRIVLIYPQIFNMIQVLLIDSKRIEPWPCLTFCKALFFFLHPHFCFWLKSLISISSVGSILFQKAFGLSKCGAAC